MDFQDRLKVLVFDFDGTLFHIKDMDWEGLKLRVTRQGENLGDAIQRLRQTDDPLLDEVTAAELQAVGASRVEPEIVEALAELAKSYQLAIFSRNSRLTIEKVLGEVLQKLQIYVVGREDTPNLKPHPGGLQIIMEHFDIQPDQTAIIGDTYHDVEVAEVVGSPAIVVRNPNLAYAPEGAAYYIDTIAELTRLLKVT